MKISIITSLDSIDSNKWNYFVDNHPQGNAFQTFETFLLFSKVKKIKPILFVVYNFDDQIIGVLLALLIREKESIPGFFSSRVVIYGGPLINSGKSDYKKVLDLLLKTLVKKLRNRSIFIQFRNFTNMEEYKEIFRKNGFYFMDRLNYLVDSTSENAIKNNISKSKLRQIRKGLEAGAKIIVPENLTQVREFYEILKSLYRFKVKKPLLDWSFFESFYILSKEGLSGKILLIEYQSKIIGGILCPIHNNKVIYEWYVCGLDQDYKHLYPSVLATWAAIDYAQKNKIQCFDFMGVGTPDKNYGVREFKAKFGGEMVNYGRFGRINNDFLYAITEVGYNILAMMRKI